MPGKYFHGGFSVGVVGWFETQLGDAELQEEGAQDTNEVAEPWKPNENM